MIMEVLYGTRWLLKGDLSVDEYSGANTLNFDENYWAIIFPD